MAMTRGQFAQAMAPGLRYQINQYLTSPSAWFISNISGGPLKYKWSSMADVIEKPMGWWCPACGDLLIDTNRKKRRKHEQQCGVKLDHVEL